MSSFTARPSSWLVALSLAASSFACGGGQPAHTPAKAADSPLPADNQGEAVEGDLYASFDPNQLQPSGHTDETQATAQDAALASGCQGAAASWEKRARPAIKACYREGKKSDPNLMGTARITVDINLDGKPKPAKLDGPSSLGDSVAQCMVKAVQATEFSPPDDCKGRTLTIPVQFPTPR